MKPQLLKITHEPVNSFSVRRDMVPNINSRWHYHPELELIHFHKGSGTQFIGDNIKNFKAGDIILLGSNLPHYWMYDEEYFSHPTSDSPYSTVIHFKENFVGERFLQLPETRKIRTLLEKSNRGIVFSSEQCDFIGKLMDKVYHSDGLARIIALMECLGACAEVSSPVILSSQGFNYHLDNSNDRINSVYNYTLKNFKRKIELKEIAEVAGFIPNSFCRYFKSRTGKTYNQFLLEIRIGFACKLLLDNNQSIKQICFESGFRNFVSFHKSFKAITGFTPQTYQKKYLEN
jgi:AraC-like DNA-binding protein